MALESAKVEVRATAPGMLVTQNPIRGQAPKAYVVLAKGTQLSEGEIQTFLADKLKRGQILFTYCILKRSV